MPLKKPGIMIMILLLLISSLACGGSDPESADPATQPAALSPEHSRLNSYLKLSLGGKYITATSLANRQAVLAYGNFPTPSPEYDSFLETGENLNRILMEEPLQLLRCFPEINAVDLKVKYKDKTYQIKTDRQTLQEYFKFDFSQFTADKDYKQWRAFSRKQFKKELRDPYIARFVTVS